MKVRGFVVFAAVALSGCYQGIVWDASPEASADGTDTGAKSDGVAENAGGSSSGGEDPDPAGSTGGPGPDATSGQALDETDGEEPLLSFTQDVWPIFDERCSCHGHTVGGLLMIEGSVYNKIVDVPSQDTEMNLIEPGDPTASYFFRKLIGDHIQAGGEGAIMPPGGDPLTDQQLDLVETWILQGAPE